MITDTAFRETIDAFLAETDTTATAFGKAVMGDPCFVFDLRKGRSPTLAVVNKVLDFIESQRRSAA